jgi:3'(2'), 5'-bisphosphate nucleotidase
MRKLLERALEASYLGGLEIIEVYNSDFAVETKEDKSPLTLADKRANSVIISILESTGLPVLSEEGKEIPYEKRSNWGKFWMVDPLDGTKEFIKRNGEFTVNIALIEKGIPMAGVIYVPVQRMMYFGIMGWGAYKIQLDSKPESFDPEYLAHVAEKLPKATKGRKYTAVGSRSHMSPETEVFFEQLRKEHGEFEVVSMGSSLKICLVAEGVADVYPRFAPTMEWDTAAGHAIVLAAGKSIIDYTSGKEMRYNKENLLNNWFVVK